VRAIECVPNVSEGRNPVVIDRIAGAIATTAGVRLLDRSSDRDHHRTVFTIVGEAAPLRNAILAMMEATVRLVDVRTHRGVHPRLGAVDVVPFVPLGEATMDDCAAVAREVAAEAARRLALPIFLYEEAALVPGRRRLEQLRRGQFEGLAAKMIEPAWRPDFGPLQPHGTAGATVMGARGLLIAYNINLASDKLDIAKQVASVIRESSGGLPEVKAMGVPLAERGIVQVSMNLTNFRVTSLSRVYARVREEVEMRGARIQESEIVGLVPAAALADTTFEALQLPASTAEKVLETRLEAAGYRLAL
jgi:glutamate formiminotransferase / 5-formyltetrahydrofolate cyclo-ligase